MEKAEVSISRNTEAKEIYSMPIIIQGTSIIFKATMPLRLKDRVTKHINAIRKIPKSDGFIKLCSISAPLPANIVKKPQKRYMYIMTLKIFENFPAIQRR